MIVSVPSSAIPAVGMGYWLGRASGEADGCAANGNGLPSVPFEGMRRRITLCSLWLNPVGVAGMARRERT
ncbi:MAG: hypothetical protein IJR99_10540 [Kiritimatiellae bacterium]|nr:hypothetical protein [Kiritimatiellia bacterium]